MFKILLLSLFIISDVHLSYAQTAQILPNAKSTFVDQNGKPLTSGKVYFYNPGTTTAKTTWQDFAQTTPNTNPVVLDAAGRAMVWGNGYYRQQVYDQFNNLQWDQVTASPGSSQTNGTVGDGLAVGTILPWTGLLPPQNYQLAYGQAISRTTFASLLTTLSISTNITCAGGSPIITNISDTSNISVGTILESVCASGSPSVISKTSTTVTLSSNATVSITTTGQFFLYGNGDGLTTFNVPDYRGYVLAGRCNMGGVSCSNVNSTYFSANANNTPSSIYAKGGNQSATLVTSNLPAYTPAGTNGAVNVSSSVTNYLLSSNGITTTSLAGGSSPTPVFPFPTTGTLSGVTATGSGPTFTGTAQGGTSTPFSNIQPTVTINYIIKVTPDANIGTSFISQLQGGLPNKLTGTDANGTFGNINLPSKLTVSSSNLNFVAQACSTHLWVSSIDVNGTFICAQPSFSDITGLLTYSMIQNVTAARLLGNPTGVGTTPSEISLDPSLGFAGTTIKCNTFSSSQVGCVPASGGGTTTFLRADGSFATPAGGGNVTGSGSSTSGHITTYSGATGSVIQDQASVTTNQAVSISGNTTLTGGLNTVTGALQANTAYFGGSPWFDVRSTANSCAAAVGNGSTDDTAAIQCHINYMASAYAGGVVYFPCGNYKVTSLMTVTAPIILRGSGICSIINGSGSDIAVLKYANTSIQQHWGGMENLFVQCYFNSAATQYCVEVDNFVNLTFSDSRIWGGAWALFLCGSLNCNGGLSPGGGADNTFRNLEIAGSGSTGGGLYSYNSANWFYDIKNDQGFGFNQTYAAQFLTDTSSTNAIQETMIFRMDLSGSTANGALNINDAGTARTTIIANGIINGATGGFGFLGTFRHLSILGSELGTGTVPISFGNLSIVGSTAGAGGGGAITFTGGTRSCAGNIGVTC